MIDSYKKYQNKKINQSDIHSSYEAMMNCSKTHYSYHFEEFIKNIIPLIRYYYKKICSPALTADEFDDVCNDVFEQLIHTINKKILFDNESKTIVYFSSVVKTVILQKMKYYNNLSNMNLEDVFMAIHLVVRKYY